MKYTATSSTTPQVAATARHLGALLRQRRLARGWTLDELAERARAGTATLKRMEKGAPTVSIGVWLTAFECLGLISLLTELEDPMAAALLDETRTKRARRKPVAADLDF